MTKGTPSDSTPQDAVLNEAESQTLPRYEITDADGDGDIDFKDAAILAEYDVHGHEETPETAWQHALARIGRIFAGFGLMIAGVVMIFVPGPGLLAFAAGLVILSRDFVWAEKVLRYLQSRVPGLDPDGTNSEEGAVHVWRVSSSGCRCIDLVVLLRRRRVVRREPP